MSRKKDQATAAAERVLDGNKALDARLQGKGYREIARELGCCAATAHKLVQSTLAAIPVDNVKALREVEGARLDDSEKGCLAIRDKFQALALEGNPKAADTVALMVARLSAIRIQRAKLFGANLPEVSIVETRSSAQPSEAQRIMQELMGSTARTVDITTEKKN